ncbi:hypothetical protein TKK_0007296 [Trichogramma kaykai]|uniref:Vitellogenin domain-containing protein n=1 Tax=Trichogramma kaykai TaxID=54128 RepID=A0ABD2X9M2_9HYME
MHFKLQFKYILIFFLSVLCIKEASSLKGQYENTHVYEYSAEISTEIQNSITFTSKFLIKGLINIKRKLNETTTLKNVYFIALTNLTHDSYYGRDHFRINKFQLIPEDAKELELPFLAIYDENGKFNSIQSRHSEKYEPKWSIDVKTSIAMLFQFDWPKTLLSSNNKNSDKVFVSEYTNQGDCQVLYNGTMTLKEEKISLVKSYKPEECKNFVNTYAGYYPERKDAEEYIKDQINSQLESIYELEMIKDEPFVEAIFCYESYQWNSHNKDDENIDITKTLIRQTVSFKEISMADNIYKYNTWNKKIDDKIHDKKEIDEVKDLLLESTKSFQENILKKIKPERKQLLNNIHSVLTNFNFTDLKNIYREIHEMKATEKNFIKFIFEQMIPYLGSNSGVLFIKELVINKQVSDKDAITLLKTMPLYLHSVSIETMTNLSSLINLDNQLSLQVYKSAVLSYSYLMTKLSWKERLQNEIFVSQYIHKLGLWIKDTQSASMKVLYISALANTHHSGIVEILLPFINREINNERIRLAAFNSLRYVINNTNIEVFHKFMEMLRDETESWKIRFAAYDILMENHQCLNKDDLTQITHIMMQSDNMTNYHVSTLNTFLKLEIDTFDAFNSSKANIRFYDFPKVDVVNLSPIYDRIVKMFLPVGSNSNLLKIRFVNTKNFVDLGTVEIITKYEKKIIRKQGVSWNFRCPPSLYDDIIGGISSIDSLYKKMSGMYMDVWINSPDWINTVLSVDIDENEQNNIKFFSLVKLFEDGSIKFGFEDYTKFSILSSFGLPITFERKFPYILHSKFNFDSAMVINKINFNFEGSNRLLKDGYLSTFILNPITKLSHWMKKIVSQNHVDTLMFNASFNLFTNKLKIIIPNRNLTSGYTHFISSNVSIIDDNKLNNSSCTTCGSTLTIDSVKELRNLIISDKYDFVGLQFKGAVQNCDTNGFKRFSGSIYKLFVEPSNSLGISSCEKMVIFGSDLNASISQLEINLDFKMETLQYQKKPWYFLTGKNIDLKLTGQARKTLDNRLNHFFEFYFSLSGEDYPSFSNNLKMSERLLGKESTNICVDVIYNAANISDTTIPDDKTALRQDYWVNIRKGTSLNESCTENTFNMNIKVIADRSKKLKHEITNKTRNSECTKQKENILFTYPNNSLPLTWECLEELTINTTMNKYQIEILNSIENNWFFSLNELIKSTLKDVWKVEVKNLPLAYKNSTTHILCEVNFDISKELPKEMYQQLLPLVNGYFTRSFVANLIQERIHIINVFPTIIKTNKNEEVQVDLNHWKMVDYSDNKDNAYKISVKLEENGKIVVEIQHEGFEIAIKPRKISNSTDGRYEPEILLDGNIVNDFTDRIFIDTETSLEEEENLISLIKYDQYILLRPTMIKLSIFYSTESVTIMHSHYV